MKNKKTGKFGFTLAEVLITLGIIGIVAEITVPVLYNNMVTRQTVSMLKKENSILSQAYTLAVQDNGSTPDMWISSQTISDPQSALDISDKLSPYLKVIKNCGHSAGCLPGLYSGLNASSYDFDNTYTDSAKMQLSDGTILIIRSWGSGNAQNNAGTSQYLQNVVAAIFVDINGLKGPNTYGRDMFRFYLTKYGIVPSGTQQETLSPFNVTCINGGNGIGCAAWVLYNENMDYMKCSNLGWGGPTTCP